MIQTTTRRGFGKARRPANGRTYGAEGMNNTEAAYAGYLERLRRAGEILEYRFERLKFRMADKTFYTPDFFVVQADYSIEIHEVKGHWEDDARVKIKCVAEENPWFTFVAVKKGKGAYAWDYEYFAAAKKNRSKS